MWQHVHGAVTLDFRCEANHGSDVTHLLLRICFDVVQVGIIKAKGISCHPRSCTSLGECLSA